MHKIKKISLFMMLFGAQCVHSLASSKVVDKEVLVINRDMVEKHKRAIRLYFKQNARHRKILYASTGVLVAAAVGYIGYHYYAAVAVPTKVEVPNVTISDITDRLKGLQGQVAVQGETLNKISGAVIPPANVPVPAPTKVPGQTPGPETGWQTVKSMGKEVGASVYGFLKQCGTIIVTSAPTAIASSLVIREIPTLGEVWGKLVSEPWDRICHPGDSKWFLRKQAHYEELFKHLELRAQELPLSAVGFERNHFVTQVTTDINVLVYQLARVIAFLEMQAKLIGSYNKVCGTHLSEKATFVYNLVEDFSKQIGSKLSDVDKHAEVPATITTLRRKLKEEFDSFHVYERAAFYDIIPSE